MLGLERQGGHPPVIGKIIGGIVGRADRPDAELVENALRPEVVGREQRVGFFPDRRRRGFVEQCIDPEVSL